MRPDPASSFRSLSVFLRENADDFKKSKFSLVTKVQRCVVKALNQMDHSIGTVQLGDLGVELAEDIGALLLSLPSLLDSEEVKAVLFALGNLGLLTKEKLKDILISCLDQEKPLEHCKALADACPNLLGVIVVDTSLLEKITEISSQESNWEFFKEILTHPDYDLENLRIHNKPSWEILAENEEYDLAVITLQLLPTRDWPKDSLGRSPQHFAAATNNVCFAIYLQQLTADFNEVDKEGYTPLERAVELENTEMTKFLLAEMKIQVNPQSPILKNLIFEAAQDRNFGKIFDLVCLGVGLSGLRCDGKDLILFFIENRRWELVEIAFEDLKLNSITDQPLVLIQKLAERKCWDILEKLLALDPLPNIDAILIEGMHLVDFLVEHKQWRCLDKLIKSNHSTLVQSGGKNFLINFLKVQMQKFILAAIEEKQFELCGFLVEYITIETAVFNGKKIYQYFLENNVISGLLISLNSLLVRRLAKSSEGKDTSQIDASLEEIIASLVKGQKWEILKVCIDQFGLRKSLDPILEEMCIDGHPLLFHAIKSDQAHKLGIVAFIKGRSISKEDAQELLEALRKKKKYKLIAPILFRCSNLDFDMQGDSLAKWLVKNRFWDALGIVIMKCIRIEELGLDYKHILEEAAKDGDVYVIQALLQKKVKISNFKKYAKVSVLFFLIKNKLFDLIEPGMYDNLSSDEVDVLGYSPLHYAMKYQQTGVCLNLVKAGASLSPQDFNFDGEQKVKEEVIVRYLDYKKQKNELSDLDSNTQILIFLVYPEAGKRFKIYKPLFLEAFDVQKMSEQLFAHLHNQKIGEVVQVQPVVYPGDLSPLPEEMRQVRVVAACQKLRHVFARFEEADLEEITNSENELVSPEKQRENFKFFLKICQNRERIAGVGDNLDEAYNPIRYAVEHLALVIDDLQKEDKLTYLSQFSTIDIGYCLDPYKTAAKSVYLSVRGRSFEKIHKMLKEKAQRGEEGDFEGDKEGAGASSPTLHMSLVEDGAIEIDDPNLKFQREVLKFMAETRDQMLESILHVYDGVIDTHAVNWVYRHFGPEVGIVYKEKDIYLEEHGRVMLAHFLGLSHIENSLHSPTGLAPVEAAEVYKGEVRKRFWSYSKLALFMHFKRFMQKKFDENTEQIIDYYHFLVELDKSSKMETLKSIHKDLKLLDKLISIRRVLKRLLMFRKKMQAEIKFKKLKNERLKEKIETLDIQASLEKGAPERYKELVNQIKRAKRQLQEVHEELAKDNDVLVRVIDEIAEVEKQKQKYSTELSEAARELDQIEENAEWFHGIFTLNCIDIDEMPPYKATISSDGIFLLYRLTLKYLRTNFS